LHEAILHLPNGNTFTIKANALSSGNKYVKAIRLNGKPLKYFSINYKDIEKGGTLEYDMIRGNIK